MRDAQRTLASGATLTGLAAQMIGSASAAGGPARKEAVVQTGICAESKCVRLAVAPQPLFRGRRAVAKLAYSCITALRGEHPLLPRTEHPPTIAGTCYRAADGVVACAPPWAS